MEGCKFCYKIGDNKDKKIIWSVRSCMADQNIDELYGEFNDKNSHIAKEYFEITPYKNDNGISVSIEYRMEMSNGIIVNPFSEAIKWSFCPFCGRKISHSIKTPDEIYEHQFDIEDIKYDNDKVLDNCGVL